MNKPFGTQSAVWHIVSRLAGNKLVGTIVGRLANNTPFGEYKPFGMLKQIYCWGEIIQQFGMKSAIWQNYCTPLGVIVRNLFTVRRR